MLLLFDVGLHFIQAPDALKSFVSIQQEFIHISSVKSNQKFLTADNIELHIAATIFYRIFDVKTMFTTRIKDHKDLEEIIHSQATATLLTIIRSENFQGMNLNYLHRVTCVNSWNIRVDVGIGKKSHLHALESEIRDRGIGDKVDFHPPVMVAMAQALPGESLASPDIKSNDTLAEVTMGFQNIIHDAEPQFKHIMQSNFNPSGIEIQSLRIEQIEFADSKMQQQISQFALQFTKLSSQVGFIVSNFLSIIYLSKL